MFDIIICGSGLAGSVAATVLSKQGYRVALIDRHAPDRHPPEFRAEQIVGVQVEALRYLGVLDSIVEKTRNVVYAEAFRYGRSIDRSHESHYGLPYCDIVLGARRAVPENVTRITGRLRDMAFSDDQQVVTVEISRDHNQTFQGRLVVLATGLTPLERFGFGRDIIRADHSLSFAFDVRTHYRDVMAAYGERIEDRIDYVTLFPMADRVRANLFCYQTPGSDWAVAFKRDPERMLEAAMPGLRHAIGEYKINGSMEARAMTLYRTTGVERPGVVVIGDAFQTSCPAVGGGIGRVLTDIDRLSHIYIPRWWQSHAMPMSKISEFYADPVKQAQDAEALRAAEYRRNSTIQTSVGWRLHRTRVIAQRRLRDAFRFTKGLSIPPMIMGAQ
jgi:2-polyprenyl-6-methoxyphenol hydroxylase-like FAD-dependent oxidoreductase